MIYVVLGMHKSGTTLVSQILHRSGISMGEHFDAGVSYDHGNKYEREAVLGLNMAILDAGGYGVLGMGAERGTEMTFEQRELMRAVIRDCGARHDDWGFKDPRTALTYGLWREELPEHKVVAIFREPSQVWPRFKWRGRRKYLANFLYAQDYLNRWYEHNANILAFLESGASEALVLGYHELMTSDAEFDRLRRFVGRDLDDQRRPGLYRSKHPTDVFIRYADRRLRGREGRGSGDVMAELAAWRIRTGA